MSAGGRAHTGRLARTRCRVATVAFPVGLLALLAAGFALAPTATRRADGSAANSQLLPPAASKPAGSLRARVQQVTRSTGGSASPPPTGRGRSRGEVGDPEGPPSPASSRGAMLAIARQFALAYMPYQIGRLPRWARAAITRTCAPRLARYLLAHPARQTPLLAAHSNDVETYRVASVNLAAGANRAAVSYVAAQDPADTGAFLLTLAKRRGRWLIAGLQT